MSDRSLVSGVMELWCRGGRVREAGAAQKLLAEKQQEQAKAEAATLAGQLYIFAWLILDPWHQASDREAID
jgi:hypothetical protein